MAKTRKTSLRLPTDLFEEAMTLRERDDTERDVIVRVLRAGLAALKKRSRR